MLENNLHPDVAEKPSELIVYGGIGKAARDQASYQTIRRELTRLADDETLLVQSGKPVGVFNTHEYAPRVLIANTNLVPEWATWEHFRKLDEAGLIMYGQMTAGSWIYIGSQGILQGTYETFAAAARKRFGGSLRGRLVVTAGLGGMGGAQPLAVTMCGGTALCVEVDLQRIERRLATGYLDERAADLDDALARLSKAAAEGRALSIGLLGNAAEVLPELVRRNVAVDVVTDQTSAHDPLNGYVPPGLTVEQADALRQSDPDDYLARVGEAVLGHVGAIRELGRRGAEAFDYGNALRGLAAEHGDADAFEYPGFVPAYIRPLFCEGKGPFRWVALSGDPEDIHRTDEAILDLFGDQEHVANWIRLAREKVHFQGLPARICWLGYGERHLAGLRFNEMVASGELKAPIVIGRDHLDSGSVASPQRETEAMQDGSDAVADWPILNALLEHRLRRELGVRAPRRRRRHGQVDPRRPGRRRRRHQGRRGAGAPRAGGRPGPGRRAPRGCRLRAGDRVREGLGPADADARPRARVSTIAITGAAQVLRPQDDGHEYLRHDCADEQLAGPGSLRIEGETIAGFEESGAADVRIDATGCAVIPGFVDCHTHLPFAGWREREYELKIAGESYETIARAGGGIRSSARSLAESSDDEVLAQAQGLAREMLAHGTTTFECKSGYGLSPDGEVRSVALAAALRDRVTQATRSTALLAHAVPEGYDPGSWMSVVAEMLP